MEMNDFIKGEYLAAREIVAYYKALHSLSDYDVTDRIRVEARFELLAMLVREFRISVSVGEMEGARKRGEEIAHLSNRGGKGCRESKEG